MINQQLIDYIRQQLTAGVTREIIKTALISQGWSEQDINEGFTTIEKPTTVLTNTQNTIWSKGIPRTNNVFIIISLLLVFGLDLFIIISDSSLLSFWYMMLGVLALFSVFFYFENFVFRKKFANTTSALDKWISMVVGIRNLIFLLNFIPFIQLLGLAALAFIGWIILLIYIGLIIGRYRQTK
jgi:hypothetical protein